MKQNKAKNGSYYCEFCGSENAFPPNLSNYLIEGEYTVRQRRDQEPKPKKYRLFCQQCGRPNEKWI